MALSRARRPVVLLTVLASLALAATFLRPTLPLTTATYRYVFVYDITESMNAEDLRLDGVQVSRLDYAKRLSLDALRTLPCGTEAGLALFAGHRAFLLLTPIEVCANYRELGAVLDNISWRMSWEPRSEVAKGLYKSIALMPQLPAQTRLVFFTDGDEAPPIDPAVVPRFDGEPGEVRGLVVGVGGTTPVPIPKFDEDGRRSGTWTAQDFADRGSDLPAHMAQADVANAHLSALDADYLVGLADRTGLGYLQLEGIDALRAALAAAPLGIPRKRDADIRGWLAALAGVALLASLWVAHRQARTA